MPSRDDRQVLHPGDVSAVVADACFAPRSVTSPGSVGLEVERFPIVRSREGRPAGRVPIRHGDLDSLSVLEALVRAGQLHARHDVAGVPSFPCLQGGRVTFEPGGVVEHATAPHATAAGALAEVAALGPALADAFDEHGVVLASIGVDPWHDVDEVPVQLDAFRYPAMARYFARRGVEGRVIMRHSASMQVNLDTGAPGERSDRWLLANLLSPLLTATFANSPIDATTVAGRARAWQGLDGTRTGFPRALVDGSATDPVEQMVRAALEADVLLLRTATGEAEPGEPGWTFGDWLRDGRADHGHPTVDDLRYHLSTMFHEVRPRGALEFRAVDALPHRWRVVPVVLLCGALEDRRARDRLLDLLEPRRRSLPLLWEQAAGAGVGDPSLCALTVEAWSYAMAGASRLPEGYLPDDGLSVAEAFLERFTLRGRSPADEFRSRLDDDPAVALVWAAEPVPERTRR